MKDYFVVARVGMDGIKKFHKGGSSFSSDLKDATPHISIGSAILDSEVLKRMYTEQKVKDSIKIFKVQTRIAEVEIEIKEKPIKRSGGVYST